jgi:hypothetical protein
MRVCNDRRIIREGEASQQLNSKGVKPRTGKKKRACECLLKRQTRLGKPAMEVVRKAQRDLTKPDSQIAPIDLAGYQPSRINSHVGAIYCCAAQMPFFLERPMTALTAAW